MKDIITSREELLWAKLAGRNVYLSTMTPPVASSMKEKLMLETADRIDQACSGGGGGSEVDYIDADIDIQTGTISNASMTVAEAITAKADNYLVFRCTVYDGGTETNSHVYVPIGSDAGDSLITFETVTFVGGEPIFVHIHGSTDWSASFTPLTAQM